MSEDSNNHSGSPSGSTSSTLEDDASRSPSRQSSSEKNSNRKVSFPEEETDLVTGYLEPPNPWQYAVNATREDLISHYKSSCLRHGSEPLPRILQQLKEVDIGAENVQAADDGKGELGERSRFEILDLKGEHLRHNHCEPLEEILKRLQFQTINLENTFLDDEASAALFDMVEYYEAAKQLNISSNSIGQRGWQACSQMLRKTRCLEKLVARNTKFSEQLMPSLCRGLRIGTNLQILHLENCNLSGRSIDILVNALKTNTALKELHLADNGLGVADAMQLGGLLHLNFTLQLLDISNNYIQDRGVGHICEGLVHQAKKGNNDLTNLVKGLSEVSGMESTSHRSWGDGLAVLILWNNQLTKNSSEHIFQLLAHSKSLDTLNIGQNALTSEILIVTKEALQQTRSLERLGLQSTRISCEGAIALAECIAVNSHLQRIDLRDNPLQIGGLMALSLSMKVNHGVTRLDLDDNPKGKLDGGDENLKQYRNLVKEIREYCARNLREAEREREKLKSSNPKEDEQGEKCNKNVDGTGSPVHNASSISRKISLTCETLLRTSAADVVGTDNQRLGHNLAPEPRRVLGVGARLRSPAPSPIPSPSPSPTPSPTPSPHSSPVPSPSRSRFHVSRVQEPSYSGSSDGTFFLSAPTSSPIPSLSPTSSIPSSGGSSRFKVTLVSEPKFTPNTSIATPQQMNSSDQNAQTVVTRSTGNVTIGFNPEEKGNRGEKSVEKDRMSSSMDTVKECSKTSESTTEDDDDGWNFDEPSEVESNSVISQTAKEEKSKENSQNETDSRTKNCTGAIAVEDKVISLPESENIPSCSSSTSCPDIIVSASHFPPSPQGNPSNKSPHPVSGRIRKLSNVIPPSNVETEPPPRIQSSLERLLGLFQHPASIFGKSSGPNTQSQNVGSQPSSGVGFFFGSPNVSTVSRQTKQLSSETQQLRNANSSSLKSPPSPFSSMIFSNVMQEVSAIRNVFPNSQGSQEKSIFSLCSGKPSGAEYKDALHTTNNNTSSFLKSEDSCVHSDNCYSIGPMKSQFQDDFHESSAVSLIYPNDKLTAHITNSDNPNQKVSVSESIGSQNKDEEQLRDNRSSDNIECGRTGITVGITHDTQECMVESKHCSSVEEQLKDSSLDKTGSSTDECITLDKEVMIAPLSPAVSEEVSTAELVDTSCDFSDPNSDTYSDEIENLQAVKDIEIEEKKIWCDENELVLDTKDLGQNLQLDILATCYAQDEEKKLVKGDEIGCATLGVGMSCDNSEAIADLGGNPKTADILSHIGGQKGKKKNELIDPASQRGSISQMKEF